jgi:hypothetical protein
MMTKNSLAADREAAIQESMRHLFGHGTLASKLDQVVKLQHMSGLDAFMTGFSWHIGAEQRQLTKGYSETLTFACKDIHAHLVQLGKQLPPETPIEITIENNELPATQPRRSARTFESK